METLVIRTFGQTFWQALRKGWWIPAGLALSLASTVKAATVPAATPLASPIPSNSSPMKEIHVTLFGQSCLLTGPIDETILSVIHSISPEKIPPTVTIGDAKKSLEEMKKLQNLPPPLDPYREKLTKRLENQLTFLGALEVLKKDGLAEPFLKATKDLTLPKRKAAYEAAVKKAAPAKKKTPPSAEAIEQLTESFNESIEPHPEEEFHRVIRRMEVFYTCSLEENDDE